MPNDQPRFRLIDKALKEGLELIAHGNNGLIYVELRTPDEKTMGEAATPELIPSLIIAGYDYISGHKHHERVYDTCPVRDGIFEQALQPSTTQKHLTAKKEGRKVFIEIETDLKDCTYKVQGKNFDQAYSNMYAFLQQMKERKTT